MSSKKRERKERISTNDRWGEIGTNKGEWGEGGEIGERGVDCVQWGGRRGFGTRESRGIDDANGGGQNANVVKMPNAIVYDALRGKKAHDRTL